MQVSKEHIENAMRLIQDSESLRATLSDAQNLDAGIKVLIEACKDAGMDINEADLRKLFEESLQSRELNDEQLESVTGGVIIIEGGPSDVVLEMLKESENRQTRKQIEYSLKCLLSPGK